MSHVSRRNVPFYRPLKTGREAKAVTEALESGALAGGGPIASRVEERLRELLGAGAAFLLPTCTHALEMAIRLLQPRPGDEFIVPSYSYVSDANAVLLAGAQVVFAEIEPDTMTLDPDDVATRISSRTKGIVAVHYGGHACNLDRLERLCKEQGIALVEDAAHAIGATYRGRALGAFGDMGCLSFHETKGIHCGEGGALLTNDKRLAERAAVFRDRGTNRVAFERGDVDFYTWVGLGSSLFLPEPLAALLEVQLRRTEQVTRRLREIAALYDSELASVAAKGVVRLPPALQDCKPNFHVYFLHLPEPEMRTEFIERMGQMGVDTRFHFVPLHSSPFGRSLFDANVELPTTERAAATLVRLPIYVGLSNKDVCYVADCVGRVLQTMAGAA